MTTKCEKDIEECEKLKFDYFDSVILKFRAIEEEQKNRIKVEDKKDTKEAGGAKSKDAKNAKKVGGGGTNRMQLKKIEPAKRPKTPFVESKHRVKKLDGDDPKKTTAKKDPAKKPVTNSTKKKPEAASTTTLAKKKTPAKANNNNRPATAAKRGSLNPTKKPAPKGGKATNTNKKKTNDKKDVKKVDKKEDNKNIERPFHKEQTLTSDKRK